MPTEGSRAAGTGDYLRQFAVIVATLATIVVNGLATNLPLNNQTTAEISDRFPSLFTPAGYVFSIWGVIYLGLLAYTVYQALPSQRTNARLRAIGWLYVASGVANSVWIFMWHYNQFALSLVVMLVLLVSLILIYQRLNPWRAAATKGERWTTHIPFSIYLGWITVATVANVATVLLDIGWDGWFWPQTAWALAMISIATLIGLFFAMLKRDVAYVAVLVWAFVGIAVKQSATPPVVYAAMSGAIVLTVAAAVGWFGGRAAKTA